MFVANQDVDALPTKLRSAMSAATGTKYASTLGGVDLNFMSKEMRTTSEYLAGIRADKERKIANFACFVRSDMAKPIIVSIPFGNNIDKLPKMTTERYQLLRDANNRRISIPTTYDDGTTDEMYETPEEPPPSPAGDVESSGPEF
jgi:hypothetical protein